jgi:cell division protein FtsI (penicillin-binding protein 3)
MKSIITYLFLLVFALAIVARILYIQIYEGSELREMGLKRSVEERKIDALRGNIYSINNSLLAVTIPKYEIRMDVISNKSDRFFNANVDSLAFQLSKLFRDRSKNEYKKLLTKARQKKNYYLLIKRNVSYKQLLELKTFPILRLGRNKGGLIIIKSNKRELPYNQLAKRTIGIYNYESGAYEVGLEGAFNETLNGTHGTRLMQKIEGGTWMPIDPANEIKPQNGNDLITTIDIDIQDVTENSLRRQLEYHQADHGCAIVMEVATGEIRAIANLGREKDGSYTEKFNYAIGEASEPGSTFKLASILVALEDGVVNLNDSIDTENGSKTFYNATIRDAHKIDNGIITVRRAIEASSNVGIAKIIWENYANDPQKFIDGLYKLGLQNKLEIPIKGEATPYIKNTKDKSWSGISLPWIAYGYELKITPLQLLTFYNAIANNGVMVKPMFVKEIRSNYKTIEEFKPIVINEKIASDKTLEQLQSMLEGVVLRGTARNIKNEHYAIAGKTGTAQIAQGVKGYNKTNYKASFCGYFPANDPKFSCIVVINNPTSGNYYGNAVAAPVFKSISDRIFSSHVEMAENEIVNLKPGNPAIYYRAGNSKDFDFLYKNMQANAKIDVGSEYVIGLPTGDSVHYAPRNIKANVVPKLTGMTAKDAVYLLEDMGLNVKIVGSGFVTSQSLEAGTKVTKGKSITLKLSDS